jgi:hypothetical protein
MLFAHTQLPAYVPGVRRWVDDTYPRERYAAAGAVEVLSGACLLFRREALERAGYLDDRLVLNYDDVEWSLRAGRAGMRLDYVPAAEVTHLGGQSRAFDAESSSVASVASICAFWDVAFAGPAAAVLKLNLLLSVALTLSKNAVMAPFVPWRRAKLATVRALLACIAGSVARPLR